MNCPRCGTPIPLRRRNCEVCGFDMMVFRRVRQLSNLYYNRGFEKARVRDLSGAVIMLKRSLEMYKRNTVARNLLGLVYFEMGETVAALSEWVISKNIQQNDNMADYFINKIQENPTKLDNYNQAIRKYNAALEAARDKSDDLALIQLKKAISLNPGFLSALQLMALVYMRNNEFRRADKLLKEASRIDVSNIRTLRYMKELELMMNNGEGKPVPYWSDSSDAVEKKSKGIAPISNYREDKPSIMLFGNLIIGVIIGILVVCYLIIPTVEQNIKEEYNSQKVDYSSELSSKTATITQLEKQIDSLNRKLEDSERELTQVKKTVEQRTEDKKVYGNFFGVMTKYIEMMKKPDYTDEELIETALALYGLDTEGYQNQEAITLITALREEIYPLAAKETYKLGRAKFDSGDYEEAINLLGAAAEFDDTSDSALYYLGKSYQAVNRYDEAAASYRLMLEEFPNSTLKQYVPQRLGEMGFDIQDSGEDE